MSRNFLQHFVTSQFQNLTNSYICNQQKLKVPSQLNRVNSDVLKYMVWLDQQTTAEQFWKNILIVIILTDIAIAYIC